MKQILIIYVVSALALGVNGRTLNERISYINNSTTNVFNETKFDLDKDKMVFSELPKHTMEYYIMNEKGDVELSGTVSRKNNSINIALLSQGYHTVALKQGSRIRMFGYYADIVIKGKSM